VSDRKPAHGVVLLAAGASTRLGQPKQLVLHRGETLVHRAARIALATQPKDAVVVVGAEADAVFAEVEAMPIRRADCSGWRHGMGASLRTGVAALAVECTGVLVVLCDQPALDAAHLVALRDAWFDAPERGAASFYANKLGVPALLPRTWFGGLYTTADRGMRELLVQQRDQVTAISNSALVVDIDLPSDLRHLS
jgi:CTP:molybdopterin cytidylyltransferase MocA